MPQNNTNNNVATVSVNPPRPPEEPIPFELLQFNDNAPPQPNDPGVHLEPAATIVFNPTATAHIDMALELHGPAHATLYVPITKTIPNTDILGIRDNVIININAGALQLNVANPVNFIGEDTSHSDHHGNEPERDLNNNDY